MFTFKGDKAVAKKVQYANLQLLVGHHVFPPKDGTSDHYTAPYAPRLRSNCREVDVLL